MLDERTGLLHLALIKCETIGIGFRERVSPERDAGWVEVRPRSKIAEYGAQIPELRPEHGPSQHEFSGRQRHCSGTMRWRCGDLACAFEIRQANRDPVVQQSPHILAALRHELRFAALGN